MKIFIPGNTPSLKNAKDIVQIPIKGVSPCPVCKKRKGRPMLIPSKTHKKYKIATQVHWMQLAATFRNEAKDSPKPLRVHFLFIRGSRRRFDYTSPLDTCQDLMVEFGWIADDNADELLPIIEPYQYDKEKPGVYIWVDNA